jgi:cytochrome c oxidase subunit 2
MRRLILAGLTLTLSLGIARASATGNAADGKTLYVICLACHGENGEGNPAIHSPTIGGQENWYVERQLQYFKSGIRGTHPKDVYGAQMRPMSMTLTSDQAIADVAAFVSSLAPPRPKPTITGDAATGGAFYPVCAPCHGANGEGLVAFDAPRLAGQHDWYVVQQLTNFREGIRGSNPEDSVGVVMRAMSMTLIDDAAVRNMAAFISTLESVSPELPDTGE